MTKDVGEIFAVVVEGRSEAPILMEAEAEATSLEAARARLDRMLGSLGWVRGCVVRLQYESGNKAVLHAMKGMQE